MSRPIEIDRDRAFSAAAATFWCRGYRATSLQDLLSATGMGRSSFYAAFGSKEALFEAVIADYRRSFVALLKRSRATRQGLSALEAFLDATLIRIPDAQRRRGCLLVNSVLELEGVDARLHALAVAYLAELDRAVGECLAEAARGAELRPELDPDALAALLVSLIEGWRVASRTGLSRQQLRLQVDRFFELIRRRPPPSSGQHREPAHGL